MKYIMHVGHVRLETIRLVIGDADAVDEAQRTATWDMSKRRGCKQEAEKSK